MTLFGAFQRRILTVWIISDEASALFASMSLFGLPNVNSDLGVTGSKSCCVNLELTDTLLVYISF